MKILGIETSCDETSAAIYDGKNLLSNIVASQSVHEEFGGVVPELASREHIRNLTPVIRKAFAQANCRIEDIGAVAVTQGPGLMGALLVGINFAKGLAFSYGAPLIGVNHIEGHIFAIELTENVSPPFLSLVVSGGHTQLVLVKEFGDYQLLGKTLDDAAGEAFDKVAKMMELGYPGGPIIDEMAKKGNGDFVAFPRALIKEKNYNFSFSGLKTAVLYYLKSLPEEDRLRHRADIVASFQKALVDVLVKKTISAAEKFGMDKIVLAGGVARNSFLRDEFQKIAANENKQIYMPEAIFCTDNAAMVAYVGHRKFELGQISDMSMTPMPGMRLVLNY
ncbi:MAG: tRNA (adenosine(37)-N6)-threonylcarbamoyltransferase complex transferase subunit TsaD [Calditrichaeota bacterium]|nr:tRNA (adenosine(37)-N6)-threonylcarbamoyltransferase complex transferase subunit TsaD [Calditrichota bacterium]